MGNIIFSEERSAYQPIQFHQDWIQNKPHIVSCTLMPMNLDGVSIEDAILKPFNPYRTDVLIEVAKHLTHYLSSKSAYVVNDAIWFLSDADDKYALDTELITSHVSSMATTLFYHYWKQMSAFHSPPPPPLMVYFETEIVSSNNNDDLIEFLQDETKHHLYLRTTTYAEQSDKWYKKQKGFWDDDEKERIRNMYMFGSVVKSALRNNNNKNEHLYIYLPMSSPLDDDQNIRNILFNKFIDLTDDETTFEYQPIHSDMNPNESESESEGEGDGEDEEECDDSEWEGDDEIEIEKVDDEEMFEEKVEKS